MKCPQCGSSNVVAGEVLLPHMKTPGTGLERTWFVFQELYCCACKLTSTVSVVAEEDHRKLLNLT